MKIDKTKEEFLDALEAALHNTNPGVKPWVNTVADALVHRLNLEFREEPELPKELGWGGDGAGLWVRDSRMRPRDLTEAEEREAAARYNAVERFLVGASTTAKVSASSMKGALGWMINQERERLLHSSLG